MSEQQVPTINEVAEILKLAEKTVYSMAQAGEIPTFKVRAKWRIAQRRNKEGRTDDGVARLYQAIEAVGQVALKERHEIESTEKIALDRVPLSLRSEWTFKTKDGVVALGLQDAYTLLASLDDSLGHRFKESKLEGTKSPLTARNRSILAHGFDRVSANVFDKLWNAALALADITDSDLPSFPVLGEQPKGRH